MYLRFFTTILFANPLHSKHKEKVHSTASIQTIIQYLFTRNAECGVQSVECGVQSLVEQAAESDASTALQDRETVIIIMINKIER